MTKILGITRSYYLLADTRSRREAEALAMRGDQVDFIALAEPNHPPIEVINNVRVIRLPLSRYRGSSNLRYILSYFKFFIFASLKTCSLFLKNRYQVIHVHTMPDFIVFVALIPKLLGAKVILDMHETMPELYMSKFGLPENHFLIRLIKFQEKISFMFADKILCVHEPHKALLIKRGAQEKKITVVLNLPDPQIFGNRTSADSMDKQDDKLRIVYHGTVAERLGLDIALKAFHEVVQEFPDARFEIYGDGDFSKKVEELIQELGLEKNVYFSKKFFRLEEVLSFIRGATFGIIPNRKDSATEYMLPVKMLEYLYVGIPVIVPKLLTINYYFDENSMAFYTPGDYHQLAQVIIRLYLNKTERRKLIENSQKFLDRFSWDLMKQELFKVIDN
jgi:glycosyltransferase involved in cell wall biosynthesis